MFSKKQNGLSEAKAVIIAALITVSGAFIIWGLGAIANKNKGQPITVAGNLNTGIQVLGNLISGNTQNTTNIQIPSTRDAETKSVLNSKSTQLHTERQSTLNISKDGTKKSELSSTQIICDDNLRRSASKQLVNMEATKSLSYLIASYPCARELTLYLSGRAITTESSGARTAEFSITDGARELCKASAVAPHRAEKNAEFSSSISMCKVDVAAYKELELIAELKSSNKADPLSILLTINASAK